MHCGQDQQSDKNDSIRLPLCRYFSSDARVLVNEIDWCRRYSSTITSETSNTSRKVSQTSVPILLVPHGAYCDSGPLQMSGFDHFLTSYIDTVIVIGTEHESSSTNVVNCSDHRKWRTPLGDVPVNELLLKSIMEFVSVDKNAFMDEHSVENQLPFLQTILRQPWTMVALSVHGNIQFQDDLDSLVLIGQKLANLVQTSHAGEDNHRVAVIGSTDYTHAGPFYGELPTNPTCSLSEYIRSKDEHFINFLCGPSLPDYQEIYAAGKQLSMCGLGTCILTAEVARNLGQTRARLLHYAVGSDICERGLRDQTGFATIIFE